MYTAIPPRGDPAGVTLLVIETISLSLALTAIVLRIWARHIKRKPLAFDDYGVIVGWFFAATLYANHIISVTLSGLGQHEMHVSADSIILTFQLLPAAESCWACAVTAIKLSILYFYTTVFSLRRFCIAAYVVAAAVIALGIAAIIQCLAICRPFQYQWDKSIEGGVCGNQNLAILMVAFFNLATDISIVVLPMPLLWKLKMPVSKKWALTAIFGLGIFICAATICRIVFTFILIHHSDDSTYWISINGIFLILEPNLGIINACLPILKPIIPRLRPKKVLWPSFSHKSSESTAIQLHTVTREDARYFKRLEDVPCLPGDIEAQTINEVTAQSQSDITGLGDILPTGARRVQDEGSRPRLPANAITVTASWDVQSTPTDHV